MSTATAERLASMPMPQRIRALPRDARGWPVPRFVEWFDGKPDFRVMNPAHMARCIQRKKCWICGEPLGRWLVFVLGPMCVVNVLTSEPPSHFDCAQYAARVCPFLAMPSASYRPARDGSEPPPGIMLAHNPGVCALWTCREYKVEKVGKGVLFKPGAATKVEWWSNGRGATAPEIAQAVGKGMRHLCATAIAEGNGAVEALHGFAMEARRHFPPGAFDPGADGLAMCARYQ
jgi:hypothetical protein